MGKNNIWEESDIKPKTNSYIYENRELRCRILEPEEGRLALTVELTSKHLGQIHHFYFQMGTKRFLGHISSSCSAETTEQDEDLSLLVEHIDLFTPNPRIPIIYSIKEIIEANQ